MVTDRRQYLKTLNVVMIDAYIYDNVDYFYVVYDVVKPADIDLFDNDYAKSIR